jgi:RNA 3'-terminal phosphate cyclase (ATP)
MGYDAVIEVHRRGHYPKGGGQILAKINPPRHLTALRMLERGELAGIEGISHCVRLPSHVAQRQANAAKKSLTEAGFVAVNIATESYPPDRDTHIAPGSGITLQAKFTNGAILGADSLGERGKPAETVGVEAASKLIAELSSGAPLDRHMGDIIIPHLAVAEGRSEIQISEITTHTLTNIKVAETLTGAIFHVEGDLSKPGTISVDGIALKG